MSLPCCAVGRWLGSHATCNVAQATTVSPERPAGTALLPPWEGPRRTAREEFLNRECVAIAASKVLTSKAGKELRDAVG